jgi:hypothetical protein
VEAGLADAAAVALKAAAVLWATAAAALINE